MTVDQLKELEANLRQAAPKEYSMPEEKLSISAME
jgi:hypothetical protein